MVHAGTRQLHAQLCLKKQKTKHKSLHEQYNNSTNNVLCKVKPSDCLCPCESGQ